MILARIKVAEKLGNESASGYSEDGGNEAMDSG